MLWPHLACLSQVVEAAVKIDGWNRRAKGIPQYIGRLIHAVDYLRWSENEGAKYYASTQITRQHKVMLEMYDSLLTHLIFYSFRDGYAK
ncbi:hypothetical protein E2C01_075031 [Portunus trituberculatus]|uniref:Uncharacterized protein n=1 Tax=Portunus trituberculatus TaxID=210409 RepID=A0A5B7I4Z3_PORTR|nr:hypothetical protein [Portunus trituberculatus]